MDFIFMLTRNDATAPNAHELVEAVHPLGLGFVGFKDIGADAETLRRRVCSQIERFETLPKIRIYL